MIHNSWEQCIADVSELQTAELGKVSCDLIQSQLRTEILSHWAEDSLHTSGMCIM